MEALAFSWAQAPAPEAAPVVGPDRDGLRAYQREAVERIQAELATHRSTLLVMATGLGKTQTFGAIAKHWPGRVLVLAHRDELIQQAQRRLQAMAGEWVEIEQADFRAANARLVAGSVQTLCRPRRLQRFASDTFDLVIVDEAHHAVAKSYTNILDHFRGAKVLGVTATPDRGDERAMGKVFETVAYRRDIDDGINDGYLAPVRIQQVHVDAINLAAVRTTAGDLNQGDLDNVMAVEEALHGVVKPTIELAGQRQTIVFTTSVENAHRLAEIFNRYRARCAEAVDGNTPFDERRALLARHKRGDFQFLCNVGVLTEGYDDPTVSCIAMARPTKSRALYTQCAGRGLRILDGLGGDTAEERRAQIAASAKADCLLLDFVGNSGKHHLVSALDVLGGRYSDEVRKRAKKLAEKGKAMMAEEAFARAQAELEKKRAREAARRANVQGKVDYRVSEVGPWGLLHMKNPGDLGGELATEGQLAFLNNRGVEIPKNLTKAAASKLIGNLSTRHNRGLSTFKQMKLLRRYGIDALNMSFVTASRTIDSIVKNGWKLPNLDAGERQPGEDG